MKNEILKHINDHQKVIALLQSDDQILGHIAQLVDLMTQCYQNGNKVLFCGNGGSAADAQHLATELSGRFYFNRAPLNAEALHVNSSFVTAVANDMGYEQVFERALEAKGKAGDILIAMSTSGNSANVINAVKKAKILDVITVGLTGMNESALSESVDHIIKVPSTDTPRIQETHILIGHIICEEVEKRLFEK